MNYEVAKLQVGGQDVQNAIILGIVLLIGALSLRRVPDRGGVFDTGVTDSIKGVAILLVVVSHLWTHVTAARPGLVLGSASVSVFLFLSGFGLTLSGLRRPLRPGAFLKRRLIRVMVPYWVATMAILAADHYILGRAYGAGETALTVLGINLTDTVMRLDYTRWFITILVALYAAHLLTFGWMRPWRAALALSVFSGIMCVLLFLDVIGLGSYHNWVAFPLGSVAAIARDRVARVLDGRARTVAASILAGAVFVGCHGARAALGQGVLSVAFSTVAALAFGAFLICALGAIGQFGYESGFFRFTGTISYELYLLHGPLLIKYNPVMGHIPEGAPVWPGFLLLLFLVLLPMAWAMHVTIGRFMVRGG